MGRVHVVMRTIVLAIVAVLAAMIAFQLISEAGQEELFEETNQKDQAPLLLDTFNDPTLITIKNVENFPEVDRLSPRDAELVRKVIYIHAHTTARFV